MHEGKPIEVAIIGGGCAGVTAAFELTRPEHRGRYHVTLYQLGWRLGGKGSSGRGPAGRIEEHGLHVWMGFYENAFRLLRECYAELGRDPTTRRFADWREAFCASPLVGLADRPADGAWQTWLAHFPPGDGLPGDPLGRENPFTVTAYLMRSAALLRALFASVQRPHVPADGDGGDGVRIPSPEAIGESIARLLRYGMLATTAAVNEAIGLLEVLLRAVSRYPDTLIVRLLDEIGTGARRQLELLSADDEVRRLWAVIDVVLATVRGIIRFGLVSDPRGFDAIDEYDWREWLQLNGAAEASVNSAFVRGLHALTFAYEDGDVRRPRLAAGAALRGTLRMMFTYRGALFWRMRAGMGDVVFAPFYQVLKRRGVRFEFFHRLERVHLTDRATLRAGERPYVAALDFDVQAEVRGGGEYQPLGDVHGVPCWPSAADYAQLVDGARLAHEARAFESHWDRRKVGTRTLRVVDDFDFVVLAVGIGAIPEVCHEIVACDPRWRRMVDHVKTVATQAFQIWMRESLEDLGWRHPPSIVSAFAQPFDTVADMRHLLTAEAWPAPPRALAYLCSVLPDPPSPPVPGDAEYPARRHEEVRRNAVHFLNHEAGALWPNAVRAPGEFRWELLVDPAEANGADGSAHGAARFASQFWQANVNPSDRYTLALPGTAQYRISPLDNTYDNLTIAGDWTACGDNTGCVEAAVISGRLAAHAIAHTPPLEQIIGYDHP